MLLFRLLLFCLYIVYTAFVVDGLFVCFSQT